MKNKKEDLRCRKILFLVRFNDDFLCPKCNCIEFYIGSNFELICKDCSFKNEVTRNTIFHNTRIGLDKYFKICIEYKKMNYQLTCNYLKKKYDISEKTSYRILKKLKNNKELINKIYTYYNYKEPQLNRDIAFMKRLLKRTFSN